MRLLLGICAVVCAFGAIQTTPSVSFSGTFGSSTISSIALTQSDGSCYESSSYYYTIVNHTFPTAGVRTINSVNVYFVGVVNGSTYNLSSLCDNSTVFPLIRGTYEIGSVYPFAHWFDANVSYTFILGGSSSNGQFVAEVWDGVQGQTWVSPQVNRSWWPLTTSSDQCYQSSSESLYDTQVVWINDTGVYNVFLAFAQNTALLNYMTPSGYPSFSVLRGNVSDVNVSAANCTNVDFVAGAEGYYLNAQTFGLSLTGGQWYTFVVTGGYWSSGETYYGHYGLTISPAHRIPFSKVLTFSPPSKSDCYAASTTCSQDTSFSSALPYGSASFQVPVGSYFYIYTRQAQDESGAPASRDLEFFLYSGGNSLGLSCGGIGSQCYDASDSDLNDVFYAPTSQWTIIAQAYYDSATYGSNASFDLYVIAGPNAGATVAPSGAPSPAPSAAPSSTSAPSSGGGTSAPSSGGGTSAPSSGGGTSAPSSGGGSSPTWAPTVVGYTYAPTLEADNSTDGNSTSVSSASLLHPSMMACALVGYLLM